VRGSESEVAVHQLLDGRARRRLSVSEQEMKKERGRRTIMRRFQGYKWREVSERRKGEREKTTHHRSSGVPRIARSPPLLIRRLDDGQVRVEEAKEVVFVGTVFSDGRLARSTSRKGKRRRTRHRQRCKQERGRSMSRCRYKRPSDRRIWAEPA
jgi:hypothetical protein